MTSIRFGVFLSPVRHNTLAAANAQVGEGSGFDFAAIQDHPYLLIAHLAGVTAPVPAGG
jgi:hypothetical protein